MLFLTSTDVNIIYVNERASRARASVYARFAETILLHRHNTEIITAASRVIVVRVFFAARGFSKRHTFMVVEREKRKNARPHFRIEFPSIRRDPGGVEPVFFGIPH